MDAQTRASVLARARQWIGTPYVHNARVIGLGVDCGHLLYDCYSYAGIPLRPMPRYPPDWMLHEGGDELYLDFLSEYAHHSSYGVPGCPVLFKVGRRYGHAGIWTERNTIIHAWGRTNNGSVQEKGWQFFLKYSKDVKFFDVRI